MIDLPVPRHGRVPDRQRRLVRGAAGDGAARRGHQDRPRTVLSRWACSGTSAPAGASPRSEPEPPGPGRPCARAERARQHPRSHDRRGRARRRRGARARRVLRDRLEPVRACCRRPARSSSSAGPTGAVAAYTVAHGPQPPADGAWVGAWVKPPKETILGRVAAVDAFQEATGAKLPLVQVYHAWAQDFPDENDKAFVAAGQDADDLVERPGLGPGGHRGVRRRAAPAGGRRSRRSASRCCCAGAGR